MTALHVVEIHLPAHLSHYVVNLEDELDKTDQKSWMPHRAPGFHQHADVLQDCTSQLQLTATLLLMQSIASTAVLKPNWTLCVRAQ